MAPARNRLPQALKVSSATLAVVMLLLSCSSDTTSTTGDPNAGGTAGSIALGGSAGDNSNAGQTAAAGALGGAAGSEAAAGASSAGEAGAEGNAGAAGAPAVSGELHLYWVDVEGGAATIIVAPDGTVLLADTGNPGGRDPGRILQVLQQEVQTDRIDHLIITHYDVDHVGGAEAVANGIEVVQFIDHGDTVEPNKGVGYPELAQGRRLSVEPGDTLELGDALLTVVVSHGESIAEPLGDSSPNPHCDGAEMRPKDGEENGMSVGYLLSFGTFDFLDLGDLTWGYEHELACPINKVGEVDLLQVPHHGLSQSRAPQLVHAVNPIAAVMSNGPTKGGAADVYETLTATPDIEHVWQTHLSVNNDAAHNADEDRIANLQSGNADQAHFVHAIINADGSFSIDNSRNDHSVTYMSR